MKRAAAAAIVALAAGGCGGSAEESVGRCRIDAGFARAATPAEVTAFRLRVERIPAVQRTAVRSRRAVLAQFLRLARKHAPRSERAALARRARAGVGPVLVITPRAKDDVAKILRSLETLPASVTSLSDRDACGL